MAEADINVLRKLTKLCMLPGPKGFRCTEQGLHDTHRCVDSGTGEVYDEWPAKTSRR